MAKNPIQSKPQETGWVTWGENNTDISSAMNSVFKENGDCTVVRDSAGYGYGGGSGRSGSGWEGRAGMGEGREGYRNVEPGHDVRSGFDRSDYDYYRPGEAVPYGEVQRLMSCNRAYHRIGIIKQMIDLMGDFVAKGICVNHQTPRIQKILRAWFDKVAGRERSERFTNLLYRLGNTIVNRNYTELSNREVTNLRNLLLSPDDEFDDDTPSLTPLTSLTERLPVKYTFLNPIAVEYEDYEIACLVKNPQLRMRLSSKVIEKIQKMSDIKLDIRENWVYLPKDETYIAYYKKDDWKLWGTSLIEPILDDITTYEKMRLADLSALDSVISQVRIWKLGSLEHKIIPTQAAFSKLYKALGGNSGGGGIDLVWTPDIDLLETSTEAHKFLGAEKYKTVLSAIYGGLGIPASLTGESQTGGTSSNSILQLKTLTERLNYGREILSTFWMNELRQVCNVLGVKTMPTLSYDYMVLQDDIAIKGLLNQLVDRGIISEETVRYRYGENNELEESRIRKEHRRRTKNPKLPQKTGPWNNPERIHDIVRTGMQNGYLSEKDLNEIYELTTKGSIKVDIDSKLEEKKQKIVADNPALVTTPTGGGAAPIKKAPAGTNGRPLGSKDKKKRKPASAFSFASIRDYLEGVQPNQPPESIDVAAMAFHIASEQMPSVSSIEQIIDNAQITPVVIAMAREACDKWRKN